MPAKGPCPKCSGQFVELDRSGIKIDACRECRGVFLDRGELDQIIAAEQRHVASVYDDDESFFRELTGKTSSAAPPAPVAPPTPAVPQTHAAPPAPAPAPQPTYTQQPGYAQQPGYVQQPGYAQPHGHGVPPAQQHHHQQYGFDLKTAERLLGDFRSHQSSHKKKHQKSLLQQMFD